MENNQNPYNQPPMGPMMPPQGHMFQRMPLRQRVMNRARRMQDVFPRWLSIYPIVIYILALIVVTFMYSAYSLPWYYFISGVIAVLVFFLYGSSVVQNTSLDQISKTRRFEKRIFLIAFIPRVLFTIILFWIFQSNYGDAFGFENSDADGYNNIGKYVAILISKGKFLFFDELSQYMGRDDISDMGYPVYVGFIYWLTDNSIIAVRLLKCVWSSLTVLLLYRLAKRNFGEQTARVAAIFCALWPNFWYYCTCHLKEVEMVFLTVLFIEQADQMLRSRQFTAWKIIPILLIIAMLFTLRTVLAIVCILSILIVIVMASSKVVSWGKRIIVGGLTIVFLGFAAGERIEETAMGLIEQSQGDYQKDNMAWRAERKDASGNTQSFAKYAGAAVFAPMIFTLPFPTMVRPFEGQEGQQLLNGGYFAKNILSFFTIFAMVILLITGKWREHVLSLSFLLGYLVVLIMSVFAQAERFHQPAMPFEFMFAAYGLSIAVTKPKYKRWFTYWCGVMFIACVAWNWFKLAGRGLI